MRNTETGGGSKTALYLRLSKDDEGVLESSSITSQRSILLEYAKAHNLTGLREYVDDGYSGTNFDRPAWQRLKRDVEQGQINCILTKDLSRLGRNSARVGDLLDEFFPAHNVRYISVIEGYDSQNITAGTAMTASVLPVMYELYARDISNKIRSSFHAKRSAGRFIGSFAPYGYRKDPADKNHLIPDPQTAGLVQEIFCWAAQGLGPGAIADRLNTQLAATPGQYQKTGLPFRGTDSFETGGWTASTVCKLLKNQVYLGMMVQGKTEKLSFKSSRTRANPPSAWVRVPNTHTPLVSAELFGQVQARRVSRRCLPVGGFENLFSGIAFCADCGRAMTTASKRRADAGYRLCCGGYKSRGAAACTNHFIDYPLLEQAVLDTLTEEFRRVSVPALTNALEQAARQPSVPANAESQRALADLERRAQTVRRLLRQLYEDRLSGTVSDQVFAVLAAEYQAEDAALTRSIAQARRQAEPLQAEAIPAPDALLDRFSLPTALTRPLLQAFVARIEVEQGHYTLDADGTKRKAQSIRLVFRFSAGSGP